MIRVPSPTGLDSFIYAYPVLKDGAKIFSAYGAHLVAIPPRMHIPLTTQCREFSVVG